ncbi:MAG: VWA domain-containing protein [candidate division Zixibacteria bacterium]|nr:VWA domain-containing protein [candidate division Zixibacteria bacterium]
MKNLIVILLLIGASIGQAGDTGTITGHVYDKKTEEPLPGANLVVKGTSIGASTNIQGEFSILEVPIGKHTVVANLIGYSPMEIKDVEVVAESETVLEFKLETASIDMGRIVVSAERPVIEKHETYTRARISDEELSESSTTVSGIVKTPTDFKDKEVKRKPKPKTPRRAPSESGLKAGFADDNKQYNYFINFLDEYKARARHESINVNERIVFKLQDQVGKSIPNAEISVYADNTLITRGKTYPDGSFFFFPSMYEEDIRSYKVKYDYRQISEEKSIERQSMRNYDLPIQIDRGEFGEVPLDILFILDTTGSMSEEIQRLKATIDLIHLNLTSLGSEVIVRFGLVLYKDRTDQYITKVVPLTADVEHFQTELEKVSAGGGGDGPEDLQSALEVSLNEIQWNPDGIRLGFIITDAPPHLDYGQEYTYVDAARDAKEAGIKLFSVGTGGLNINGEYILRQISQLTYAKYIFLTYGEEGESEGGLPGSVSHHTGSNYQTDKLEAIIIQFAKEELSHMIDISLPDDDEYFVATKIDDEESEDTIIKLFDRALSQLVDYSSIRIDSATALAVLPISPKDVSLELDSEYFTDQLTLSIGNNNSFTLADRTELQKIMEEWKLQLSGVISDSFTVKVGELTGAHVLLVGNLFKKEDDFELFLKLVRVETGELLAITKLKIDHRLGLS